jgi:hypothetical protein
MSKENLLKHKMYITLGEFANYLNELAINYRLFSASTASAFIYYIQDDISLKKLKTAIYLVLKIDMEHKSITSTYFYKTLQSINIEENSFEKIIELLNKAISKKIDLESIVIQTFNQVQIGRSAKPEHGNDIVFPNDKTLSRVHLVVSVEHGKYFIEDRSANGTFINGKKVEKGVKRAVSMADEIRIGREGTLVELLHPKIVGLL